MASESDARQHGSLTLALLPALASGVVFALLSLLAAIAVRPRGLGGGGSGFVWAVLIGGAIVVAVHLVLWLLLHGRLDRGGRTDARAAVLGMGIFLATLAAVIVSAYRAEALTEVGGAVMSVVLGLGLGVCFATTAWTAVRALARDPRRRRNLGAASLVVASAALAVAVWRASEIPASATRPSTSDAAAQEAPPATKAPRPAQNARRQVVKEQGAGVDLRAAHHVQGPVRRIVLITIDSLRWDALSCNAPPAGRTPNIDSIAREGVRFTQPHVPAPWTLPSVASIQSGLDPAVHGAFSPTSVLPDWVDTLAERLTEAGYVTAAVLSNPYLSAERAGMNQGFAIYDFVDLERRSTDAIAARAVERIRELGEQPYFLWIHFLDPHLPYDPPQRYMPSDPEIVDFLRDLPPLHNIRAGDIGMTPRSIKWLRGFYEAEVRGVDDSVGQILAVLRAQKLFAETLLVVSADHGEEFWDHGQYEHGHTLYEELLRVPLLVKLPASLAGKSAGLVVERPVSVVGVCPTILELCSVEFDRKELSAPSLVPLLSHPSTPSWVDQPLFGAFPNAYERKESVRIGNSKYILNLGTGHEELYDLAQDPGETDSLAKSSPRRVKQAREALAEQAESMDSLRDRLGGGGHPVVKEMSEAERARLRALGYIQ